MMKNEKGFSQIGLIGLLLLGIIILSGVSFYVLKAQGDAPVAKDTIYGTPSPTTTPSPSSSSQVGSVSDSNDTKTIEAELNATDLDSMDADLKSLDASADSF